MDDPDPPPTAKDHGYATHPRPLAVLHAHSLNDIRTIAHFTTKHTPPPDGQPQAWKGIVLEFRTLTPIIDPGDYLAPVNARTRWSEVLTPLLESKPVTN
ncbi:hypothetical protein GCM10010492_16220 [Saccharothrix mutabilis subsp. mutabilis]|uniref:Uncharacterized protein n=1 Tax=Saccharothrix mutabilis subsp. mutabilis TaxID=66855 RepID=A0ABN0TDN8_9PSEU